MSEIVIEKVNPATLIDSDFLDLHKFTQDLWADGSSELLQCSDCGEISWKKDVYSWIPKEIYQETVSRIFEILEQEFPIACPCCKSKRTHIIHDTSKTIQAIKDRVFNSIESSMVIMREKHTHDIVGYMDAYLDSFENAFHWELQPHYPGISSNEMKNRIETLIEKDASEMIVFPALGIAPKYRTPFILARLLKYFAQVTFFQDEERVPGLMEIGKDNTTYKIFMDIWWRSLNDTDFDFFQKHLRASRNYPSVIAVFPECMVPFREKLTRNSVRKILIQRKD